MWVLVEVVRTLERPRPRMDVLHALKNLFVDIENTRHSHGYFLQFIFVVCYRADEFANEIYVLCYSFRMLLVVNIFKSTPSETLNTGKLVNPST